MPSTTLTAAAVLTATAGALTYAALSAESQIFGPTLIAPAKPNEIAITYDDGPNPAATPHLLEVLARYEVRATFFLIGNFVRQCPDLVRQIAAVGHLIGNHTMTHPWLPFHSAARIREELSACNKSLEDTLGAPVHYFRPPHGARRPYVLRTARELGLIPVQWNIIAGDWKPIDAATIASRVTHGITRNQRRDRASNIVLHDGGSLALDAPRTPTVEATNQLLETYKNTAAKFVTIESWAPAEPSHPEAHT
ncbi:peptidoglycan/xylan/chitin deacetylase (PgdA/CDA1 family) [Edaphobacter aggregans]|uniref:Peptidoglycan/xylan/chitin deacetylase (PgdA/CDA1 family) n=1 Tax=Edaphobacter aggregans TaxID=570835 RepID=A0A428MI78_9BACT|nr:polysaccharide deacetylase family protein [Edaphobacter aggregans]RSL16634.1 peptidoglycan/xylan/chitin deacetylase (PgdA/CDA1 family) [Edaphobacter aggregans]